MLEMLLATMVETDLKVMAMATMLAMLLPTSSRCLWCLCSSWCGRGLPGSESLVTREHVGVALAGVVH